MELKYIVKKLNYFQPLHPAPTKKENPGQRTSKEESQKRDRMAKKCSASLKTEECELALL